MQIPRISGAQTHQWASPLVYLSNNGLSFAGLLLVTSAVVSWLFLLPLTFGTEPQNPYLGILAFLVLPIAFFAGLALIPLGIWLRNRRELRAGRYPTSFAPLDLRNIQLRRLLTFIAAATFLNLVIGSQLTVQRSQITWSPSLFADRLATP